MQMRICTRCSVARPITEFNKRRSKVDGLQLQCQVCCREQANARYRENPAPYKRRARIAAINRKIYLSDTANKIRSEVGCMFCPEREICVLDFHHVIKGEPVSRAYTFTEFETEVRKCVVICANCHRKIHAGLILVTINMLDRTYTVPRVVLAKTLQRHSSNVMLTNDGKIHA